MAYQETSFRELRRRIAYELGDILELTATDDGTVNRFIDRINLRTGSNTVVDRQVLFTGVTNQEPPAEAQTGNDGVIRRITSDNLGAAGGYFDVAIDLPFATATGDTCQLFNYRGRGWVIEEIDSAIRFAQAQAWPMHKVIVNVTAPSPFDASAGYFTVTDMDYIHSVEYEYPSGFWNVVPQATSRYGSGWSVNGDQVWIADRKWSDAARGNSVKAYGYQREPSWNGSDDGDTTTIPPEWLVWTACAQLCRMGRDRQTDNYNMSLVYDQKAEQVKRSIITRVPSRSKKIQII